jgi:uncharacterized C2H2 Zn-finger protein
MRCESDTFNHQSTIINHQSKSRGWKLGKRKEERTKEESEKVKSKKVGR